MDHGLPPVLLGLSIGVIFIGIVASLGQSSNSPPFGPLDTQRPHNQFGDAAITIALENMALQEEFRGKELIVKYYRDWGVGYRIDDNDTCHMNRCALVIFADSTEPDRSLVSVFVDMDSTKVVHNQTS